MTELVLGLLIGFLCGSIPTGYLVCRAKSIDIREYGSGNIGATNVARTLGRRAGALVLALDILKGFAPAYVSARYGLSPGMLAALGAVLGHTFTPFLRFKGGRGVATALGAVLGLMPLAGLLCVVVWLAVLFLTRYVSVSSMTAALTLPLWVYGLGRLTATSSRPRLILAWVLAVLVIVRHLPNMKRLWKGREAKFHM